MPLDLKALGAKTKGFLKTAGEKAKQAATEIRTRTDRAAEAVAAKVTEVTGRETTATEVKRAAVVVAGVVAFGTAAVAVGGRPRVVVPRALGGSAGDPWGSDFESQAARVFADNGRSLNYYTPHVDPTGTVYYEPHG